MKKVMVLEDSLRILPSFQIDRSNYEGNHLKHFSKLSSVESSVSSQPIQWSHYRLRFKRI